MSGRRGYPDNAVGFKQLFEVQKRSRNGSGPLSIRVQPRSNGKRVVTCHHCAAKGPPGPQECDDAMALAWSHNLADKKGWRLYQGCMFCPKCADQAPYLIDKKGLLDEPE